MKQMVLSSLLAMIRLYRLILSPLKPVPTCRFLPTCSEYAAQALSRHGVVKGSTLAVKRICRCHPWGEHGVDEVP